MKKLIIFISVLIVLSINVSASSPFFKYYDGDIFVISKIFESFNIKEESQPLSSLSLSNPFVHLIVSNNKIETENNKLEIVKEKLNIINVKEEGFYPNKIHINVGEEVLWRNKRAALTSLVLGVREIIEMRSGFLSPGESFSKIFSEPGTYTYVDGVVIGLKGEIIVE